jgi:hypothetical protein
MSFEHYPFDGCEHGAKLQSDLLQEPSILKTVVDTWHADGIPPAMPLYITEAGFSAVNFSQVPMQIEGALWLADYMAAALADGVDGVVYYQYEPVPLSQNSQCPADWGNLTMFVADGNANIRARGAQFYAAQMLTQQWFAPGGGAYVLYRASADATLRGMPLVTAYALLRPDGQYSVLLINKGNRPQTARVEFFDDSLPGQVGSFQSPATQVTFGPQQYAWHQAGRSSAPKPDDPPLSVSVDAAPDFTLPAQSITVLRGRITIGTME